MRINSSGQMYDDDGNYKGSIDADGWIYDDSCRLGAVVYYKKDNKGNMLDGLQQKAIIHFRGN